jgi:manganese transport protein
MVMDQASSYFANSENIFWKAVILLAGLIYISLLLIAIFFPFKRIQRKPVPLVHPQASDLKEISAPSFDRIAVALDFSKNDLILINHAVGQGNKNTTYLLVHVVESAASRLMEKDTDDLETRKDQQQLDHYVNQLIEKGFAAMGILGFNDRTREIVRIVKENQADMLVIGAHGHSGIKDIIYGQTIDAVRHELKIPVLVVNLVRG